MFKNNGGFTLVELIVVIAILAILAGVAVPAYSAYINNANESADEAALNAIETAMSSALSFKGINASEAANYFQAELDTAGTLTIEMKEYAGDAAAPAKLAEVMKAFNSFYKGTESEAAVTVKLSYYKATGASSDVPALLGYVTVAGVAAPAQGN